jgi:hypothetical protein
VTPIVFKPRVCRETIDACRGPSMNAEIVSSSGNDSGAPSVFPGPEGITHDAGGLTPEERDAMPYPYNCFCPNNWPLYKGAPPTPEIKTDPVLKTDEPSGEGGSVFTPVINPNPVLKTDEPADLTSPVDETQEAQELQEAIWWSLQHRTRNVWGV